MTDTTVKLNPRVLAGRRRITADYETVTDDNVVKIATDGKAEFSFNSEEALYLWRYYKGRQPILDREKIVRPEINNRLVENHAQEIVAFKIGYQLAEPLQYTLRNHDGTVGDKAQPETEEEYTANLGDLNELNALMYAEDKASVDRDLFEFMCICGHGYRMIEAAGEDDIDEYAGANPFNLYVLEPWNTFIVYSSAYHKKPLMAVWVGNAQDGTDKREYLNVYTDRYYYLIQGHTILEKRPHTYGGIPIIEYTLNSSRMGVFEPVIPLLNAINALESNRMDGIEQTVQSLMKFINCDIDEVTFKEMLQLGAVKVSSVDGAKGDVDFIKNDLDQTATQVTKDDLYQSIVNICGVPARNGTSGSSSDTGAAVILRDGWSLAESHAKNYELQFKRAERQFLRVVLNICDQSKDVDINLKLRDIELTFNRRNYENVLVKSQVLTTMLSNNKVHPELAFKACGLFTDPEAAYLQSKRFVEENRNFALELTQGKGEDEHDSESDEESETEDSDTDNNIGSQVGVPEPKDDGSNTPVEE